VYKRQGTIRAFGYSSPSSAETFNLANEVISATQQERFDSCIFATACILTIEPETGIFQYTNAGHTLPVLCPQIEQMRTLPIGGLPFGVSQLGYTEIEESLEPGDRIFLCTDGLIEARRDNEMFGENRVMSCLHEYAKLKTDDVLEQMCKILYSWTGGKSQDDVAMILIERHSD
jgi:serine phosphatase RsbU (regulator of sigma subunit)